MGFTTYQRWRGLAILNSSSLQKIGFSRGEAEKILKSIGCNKSLIHPCIYILLYRGGTPIYYNLEFYDVTFNSKTILIVSILEKDTTEEFIERNFKQNLIDKALEKSPDGVIILSQIFLKVNYGDLFTSTSKAQREIEKVKPTGYFRAKGTTRETAFLARNDVTNPREIIEKLKGKIEEYYTIGSDEETNSEIPELFPLNPDEINSKNQDIFQKPRNRQKPFHPESELTSLKRNTFHCKIINPIAMESMWKMNFMDKFKLWDDETNR